MAKEFLIKVKQSSEKLTDKAQKEISVHKTVSYPVTCIGVLEAYYNGVGCHMMPPLPIFLKKKKPQTTGDNIHSLSQ